MQLFFHPDLDSDLVQLSHEESLHCVKSLRMRQGDSISITDGKGTLVQGSILVADTSACSVQVTSRSFQPTRSNHHLHIAVAPTKNPDRIEWFLEKAVEIGIDEITPLITHNSERSRINSSRLNKIAVSALKQSLHLHLPVINPETSFSEFIKQDFPAVKMICHGHYPNPLTIRRACPPAHDAVLIIGPEGDFTPEEISLADSHNFLPVTLGPSRLRTETAALVAVCAISQINELNIEN